MPVPMADGKDFNGAKAYKDAKLCNMLTVGELNRHPGCLGPLHAASRLC